MSESRLSQVATHEVHYEPLKTGCEGMNNSVGQTVEMGATSKGKYSDSGSSSGEFNFNGNAFDFQQR